MRGFGYTDSSEARQAIHDFLPFQIKEHKTADALEVGGSFVGLWAPFDVSIVDVFLDNVGWLP